MKQITLPDWVKPGAVFAIDYGPGNPNNREYHVRGVVDDEAVLRVWSEHSERWKYLTEGESYFYVNAAYITVKTEAEVTAKLDVETVNVSERVAELETVMEEINRLKDRISIVISGLIDGQRNKYLDENDQSYYITVYSFSKDAETHVEHGRFGWTAEGLCRAVAVAKIHDGTVRFHDHGCAFSWNSEAHKEFFHFAHDPRALKAECAAYLATIS